MSRWRGPRSAQGELRIVESAPAHVHPSTKKNLAATCKQRYWHMKRVHKLTAPLLVFVFSSTLLL